MLMPDTSIQSRTGEAIAARLVGQEVQVTVAGHGAGLATIVGARYVLDEGVYATIEFGDDSPLGNIVMEGPSDISVP